MHASLVLVRAHLLIVSRHPLQLLFIYVIPFLFCLLPPVLIKLLPFTNIDYCEYESMAVANSHPFYIIQSLVCYNLDTCQKLGNKQDVSKVTDWILSAQSMNYSALCPNMPIKKYQQKQRILAATTCRVNYSDRTKRWYTYSTMSAADVVYRGLLIFHPLNDQSRKIVTEMQVYLDQINQYRFGLILQNFTLQEGVLRSLVELSGAVQCYKPLVNRTLGFHSKQSALQYAKTLRFRTSAVWGILDLSNVSDTELNYSLTVPNGLEYKYSTILLQSILEDSARRMLNGAVSHGILQVRHLPRQCSTTIMAYSAVFIVFCCLITICMLPGLITIGTLITQQKTSGIITLMRINSRLRAHSYYLGSLMLYLIIMTTALVMVGLLFLSTDHRLIEHTPFGAIIVHFVLYGAAMSVQSYTLAMLSASTIMCSFAQLSWMVASYFVPVWLELYSTNTSQITLFVIAFVFPQIAIQRFGADIFQEEELAKRNLRGSEHEAIAPALFLVSYLCQILFYSCLNIRITKKTMLGQAVWDTQPIIDLVASISPAIQQFITEKKFRQNFFNDLANVSIYSLFTQQRFTQKWTFYRPTHQPNHLQTVQKLAPAIHLFRNITLKFILTNSKLPELIFGYLREDNRSNGPPYNSHRSTNRDSCEVQMVDVHQIYDSKSTVLRNINYEVDKNRATVVLGENGAGKSTLLNILASFCAPSHGSVRYLNHGSIGFCAQQNILIEELTIMQHMHLFANLHPEMAFNAEFVDCLLEALDLDNSQFGQVPAQQLSGGNRRKLSVALAMLNCASLIVLDEPTNSLDAQSRQSVLQLIDTMKHRCTFVLSCHDWKEAKLLADNLIVMKNGQILEQGSLDQIQRQFSCACTFKLSAARDRQWSTMTFIRAIAHIIPAVSIKERHSRFQVVINDPQSVTTDNLIRLLDCFDTFGICTVRLNMGSLKSALANIQQQRIGADQLRVPDFEPFLSSCQVANGCESLAHQIFGLVTKRWIICTRTKMTVFVNCLLPIVVLLVSLVETNSSDQSESQTFSTNLDTSRYVNLLDTTNNQDNKISQLFHNFMSQSIVALTENDVIHGQSCLNSSLDNQTQTTINKSTKRQQTAFYLLAETQQTSVTLLTDAINRTMPRMAESAQNNKLSLALFQMSQSELQRVDTNLFGLSQHFILNMTNLTEMNRFGQMLSQVFTEPIRFSDGNQSVTSIVAGRSSPSLRPESDLSQSQAPLQMMNLLNNLHLKYESSIKRLSGQYSIRAQIGTINLSEKSTELSLATVILGTLFLTVLLILLGIQCVTQTANERSLGLISLQSFMGLNKALYWSTNFTFDFCMQVLSSSVYLLAFRHILGQNAIWLSWSTVVLYTTMTILQSYSLSQCLSDPKLCSVLYCTVHLSASFLHLILLALRQFSWYPTINSILKLFPSYFLTATLIERHVADLEANRNEFELNWSSAFKLNLLVAGLTAIALLCLNINVSRLLKTTIKRLIQTLKSLRPSIRETSSILREESSASSVEETSPILSLQSVSKSFGSQLVLSKINLVLVRSDVMLLLGRNGAGKSTLIKLITNDQSATDGLINISANQKSYCAQHDQLFELLTTFETLLYFGRIRGLSKSRARAQIEWLMTELCLNEHKLTVTKHLSGGNKRKLQFAIAILNCPSLIVLDEYSAGMDAMAAQKCTEILQALRLHGCAVIVSSHHPREIATFHMSNILENWLQNVECWATQVTQLDNAQFTYSGAVAGFKSREKQANKMQQHYELTLYLNKEFGHSIDIQAFLTIHLPNCTQIWTSKNMIILEIKDIHLRVMIDVIQQLQVYYVLNNFSLNLSEIS